MATLSSPGVGSGLDVNSIVTQLVALERKPIEQLQAKATTIQTQLSSFGLLQSYTVNVRDIAERIAKPEFWTATSSSSSDSTSVGVSSTASASSASYAVEVSKLAKAQSIASKSYAASTTVVGTGTLHIQLGAWDSGLTTFTPDATKTTVDIAIVAGQDSLEAVKTKINAAGAGVTASIVRDSSGERLVMRSIATGAKSAVRITATDSDSNNTDASGLSALAFNPPSAGQMTQSQAAQDAVATINGMSITSASNTLTNVVDGVTMTLAKETSAPVTVNVGLDTNTMRQAISNFAKAFSDINVYIQSQTKYDAATKKGAALQGDRPTLTLQSNLRSIFLDRSSASSTYGRLSDIGLELQTDGSFKVNESKLTAAMANPTEVAKLFSSTASSSPSAQGIAVRVKNLTSQLVASDGAIPSRTKSLRESITRNQDDQTRLESRVARVKERLLKQYSTLDTTLSQMNGVSSTLTQSLTAIASFYDAANKN